MLLSLTTSTLQIQMPADVSTEESSPSVTSPLDSVDMDDPSTIPITLGEVLVTMFDWVAAHKSTKTATKDVWVMLRVVYPLSSRLSLIIAPTMLPTITDPL